MRNASPRTLLAVVLLAVATGAVAIVAVRSLERGAVRYMGPYLTAEEAVRSGAKAHLSLRVVVHDGDFAAGLFLSDDEAAVDEYQVVTARRGLAGTWSGGGGGSGAGDREARAHIAIGVGMGSAWTKSDGTADAYVDVAGRVISAAVDRVEVTLADGSRHLAEVRRGGYLWFRAAAGLPIPTERRPVLPDHMRPIAVSAYDADGRELLRQDLEGPKGDQ